MQTTLPEIKALQQVADWLPDAVLICRPVTQDIAGEPTDFTIAGGNKAAEALLGIPLNGHQPILLSALAGISNALRDALLQQLKLSAVCTNTAETAFYDAGTHQWFNLQRSRHQNDYVLVVRTQKHPNHLAAENEQLKAELVKKQQAVEEFVYAASHDMQEPVRKINYFSERIKRQFAEVLSAEDLYFFTRLDSAANRMQQLLNDLLVYSRISLRPLKLVRQPLADTLRQVLHNLEAEIWQKEAKIVAGNLPELVADHGQVAQMLQHLLGNALKYHKAGEPPRVNITAAKQVHMFNGTETNFVALTIADEGIGFEQQYASQIFKIFNRLHGVHEYPGTGIGLAIVQKVAENHQGFVEVTSAPGEGSRFEVILREM